ncbi:hypothetical protein RJG79_10640 [Mycoplasmatota bacterium WC44]
MCNCNEKRSHQKKYRKRNHQQRRNNYDNRSYYENQSRRESYAPANYRPQHAEVYENYGRASQNIVIVQGSGIDVTIAKSVNGDTFIKISV